MNNGSSQCCCDNPAISPTLKIIKTLKYGINVSTK